MQITLESTVFDPVGVISLEALPGSDLSASTRRVTRTATLDGNAVIIDNGYTSADSTLAIEAWLSEVEVQRLQHLIQVYPEIIASTPDGCYLGVIDSVRQGGDGRTQISYLIQRTLALSSEIEPLPIPLAPVDPGPETSSGMGWIVADIGGEGVMRIENGLAQPIGLPEGVGPSTYFGGVPIALIGDGYGSILMGAWGSGGVTALLSQDRGQTWSKLSWNEGAELETPTTGVAAFGGFMTAEGSRRGHSWSTTGQVPWTYVSGIPSLGSGWEDIHSLALYRDSIYAALNGGPDGPLAVIRTDSLNSELWEVVSRGTPTIGYEHSHSPLLLNLGDRLFLMSATGAYRTSVDGIEWSEAIVLPLASENVFITSIAYGNNQIVAVDNSGQPRIYVAAADTLQFTAMTIPDLGFEAGDRLWAVAFAGDQFCVVGSRGTVITFTEPGQFTRVPAGFTHSADLRGVIGYLRNT